MFSSPLLEVFILSGTAGYRQGGLCQFTNWHKGIHLKELFVEIVEQFIVTSVNPVPYNIIAITVISIPCDRLINAINTKGLTTSDVRPKLFLQINHLYLVFWLVYHVVRFLAQV